MRAQVKRDQPSEELLPALRRRYLDLDLVGAPRADRDGDIGDILDADRDTEHPLPCGPRLALHSLLEHTDDCRSTRVTVGLAPLAFASHELISVADDEHGGGGLAGGGCVVSQGLLCLAQCLKSEVRAVDDGHVQAERRSGPRYQRELAHALTSVHQYGAAHRHAKPSPPTRALAAVGGQDNIGSLDARRPAAEQPIERRRRRAQLVDHRLRGVGQL